MRIFFYIVCLALSLPSCEYINNLTKDGQSISYDLELGAIQYIITDAPCRIVLNNSETNNITVTGIDYLVDKLLLDYRNDSLIIDHSKRNYLQKSKLIEISVSAQNIKRFTANMAVELEAPETITAENFTMVMNGGAKFAEIDLDVFCNSINLAVYGNNNIGNYRLSGSSNTAKLTIEGSVNIDAVELKCEEANIIHKSIGTCSINAISILNVDSYSSGDTYYKGSPTVNHQRIKVPYLQSSGNVIHID